MMQFKWTDSVRKRKKLEQPALSCFSDEAEILSSEFPSVVEKASGSSQQMHGPVEGVSGRVPLQEANSGREENDEKIKVSRKLQEDGDGLAEAGKYGAALEKWEAALFLTPKRAILHEQKAQVLLELGSTWQAIQAATRATELDPNWPEAWVTLARAQLSFGEPLLAVESFRTVLQMQPQNIEAQEELQQALALIPGQNYAVHSEDSSGRRFFGRVRASSVLTVPSSRVSVKDGNGIISESNSNADLEQTGGSHILVSQIEESKEDGNQQKSRFVTEKDNDVHVEEESKIIVEEDENVHEGGN